ncbi:MAG: pyrroline-5-carboxylate reductase [Spirochaetes bacterium]|nr:pyrroline-5-carboxylate reductase [Spirochaetota bacterium]
MKKVGIVGVGNMGGALAKGISAASRDFSIICYDIVVEKAKRICDEIGCRDCATIEELIVQSDIVILAVKPDVVMQLVRENSNQLKYKIVISIAAGVSLMSLEEALENGMVLRVMPNTPALVGKAMSVISPGTRCDEQTVHLAEKIFSSIGKTVILPEKMMDAVTAISGCGPAYAFTMIHAMADGGVKLGIPRNVAILLAAQTLAGAAEMVLQLPMNPIELRNMVTSPGGSTIEAVHCLERAGFSGILMDAIEAAAKKSEKLGGKTK